MQKKKKKSQEEKTVEEYFPVDASDVRHAIEKPYKPIASETISMNENKKTRMKKAKSYTQKIKSYPKKSKKETFMPPELKLKKGGYELIITEKPQAAQKIASALGEAEKRSFNGVPYYELTHKGKKLIIACTVGHLFTLKQNSSGSGIPVFDIDWVPNYMVIKKDFTKRYYDTLVKLVKNAGAITVATDYDIEGEVIGLNVVRFICGQKDASRMKFSTLTPDELNQAYEKKSKTLNWGQAIAGETRHYLDWMYGINLSRALMNSIKTTGKFKIMSIGRVQGPALNLIVEKERKIQAFKSKPYWQVFITVVNSHKLELQHNKDIFNKAELKKFESLKGKTAEASTHKKQQILPPNPPFNLTALQIEAYHLYGITPARTLQIAQSLYLAGLISYPRTSSQKLPPSIGYQGILKKLAKKYKAEKLVVREKPVEGKKTDSAHPSIFPTGHEPGKITKEEEKIYNLIVKRFLALFCEDAVIDNKTVSAKVDTNERKVDGQGNFGVLTFSARGSSVRKKGWMEIYPVKMKEVEIPDLEGEVKIINVRTEEKETQPPKRYTEASIISELEKRNLGTKATRSSIIETLYDRGYVHEKSIQATPLGISLISTMEKYSPIIIDEELTRDFEKEMDSIVEAKKDHVQKEKKIIDKAKEAITKIAKHFEEHENKIGKELLAANIQLIEQEKEDNKLNICPVCKKGNLTIMYSRKTKRFFVACDAYPKCKNTYTLPPNGLIKRTEKVCDQCGFPMLMRLSKGKRPWIFCFNPDCKTNKERIEEYRKTHPTTAENKNVKTAT
jgi:DNA topoisomerase-1